MTEAEETARNLVLSVCDLKQTGTVPSARVAASMAVKGSRLFLFGGANERAACDSLYVMELEKLQWSQPETTGFLKPGPLYGHSLSLVGADIALFGGLAEVDGDEGSFPPPPFLDSSDEWRHRGKPTGEMFLLSCADFSWRTTEAEGSVAPPHPRAFHGAAVADVPALGPLLVVFGGTADAEFTVNKILGDLNVYQSAEGEWIEAETTGTPPTARFGLSMCQLASKDKVALFGGADDSGGMFILDFANFAATNTASWTKLPVSNTPPLSRSFHTVDAVGDRIFVFAGQTIYPEISDFYVHDSKTKRWSRPLYEGQINLRGHSSAVLHDKLLVFGGARRRGIDALSAQGDDDERLSSKLREAMAADSSDFRESKKLFFLNVLEIKDGGADCGLQFKVVTIGDSAVGKSCLLTRFVQDRWADFHVATVGIDFKAIVTMVKGKLVKLQLWDTAGQERFSGVTGTYYRNADAFVLVYDATRRETLDRIDQWMVQIREHHECGPTTQKLLIGNKHDLKDHIEVTEAEGKAKAAEIGAMHVATSAKTAANVDAAFLHIAARLVENRAKSKDVPNGGPRPTPISLGEPQGDQPRACCSAG